MEKRKAEFTIQRFIMKHDWVKVIGLKYIYVNRLGWVKNKKTNNILMLSLPTIERLKNMANATIKGNKYVNIKDFIGKQYFRVTLPGKIKKVFIIWFYQLL